MEAKLSSLKVNPFEDNIVYEPREAESSVPGLNDAPLETLVAHFSLLEGETNLPRTRALHLKAQLLTSAEPGYGKSHLIGRLFQTLEKRAILIYLRPFQDPRSAWRGVLLKVAQEMEFAAFDGLAAAVWSGLMLRLIERGKLGGETADYWAGRLHAEPASALGFEPQPARDSMAPWLDAQLKDLYPALERETGRAGLRLNAPASAWLAVLRVYASGPSNRPERAAALQWIRGEWLSRPQLELLGLFPAHATVADDPDAAGRNEDAWKRFQDLCALAGFYRPLLLCFDQTELLTSRRELAADFGVMIEALVSFGLNLMTVVTTNLAPWRECILPHMQTALRARFGTPLEMEGINLEQARSLAARRLESCKLGSDEVGRFFAKPWLEDYFAESPRESVRRFLDRCALRCRQLGVGSPAKPSPTVGEYFDRLLARGRPSPAFDPAVLQWAVGPEAIGSQIAERIDDAKDYTPIRWRRPVRAPKREIMLGFEHSCDGRLWGRILDNAFAETSRRRTEGVRSRFVFLRTPEQPPLPLPSWPVVGERMREAQAAGVLSVRVVPPADLALIHAAHELYAHVIEGATPYGLEEATQQIRQRLRGWWRGLARQ